ncbi:hypothetical protein [Actinomadura rudentiformis]|nr:hypothetical protein [Actinomadura rudentiformis]
MKATDHLDAGRARAWWPAWSGRVVPSRALHVVARDEADLKQA